MASLKERVYWRAPGFLKSLLVSWHVRRLDRERFGPAYEEVLRDIATRDCWSAQQFAEYQRRQLVAVVWHAAERVPYYREAWRSAGVDPASIRGPEDLPRLPILEKQVVRDDPTRLLDETLDRRRLIVMHTSGTTGTPLELYRDVWLNSAPWAYITARFHSQAGVRRRRNRSVSVGGHMVTDPARTKPPFWVYNSRWRQLYMSSYHLSPRYLGAYVEKLRSFRPDYIEGYPSSVYAIARHVVERALEPVPMKACFTTAEPLFDYQRQAMEQAFACRTYDQYGCGEMAVFATECPAGSMHLNPEYGIVEVLDEHDQPLPPERSGQLICTSLINRVQPFIRYRIGDVGSLGAEPCECGCSRPVLRSIEGRSADVIVTPDGRSVGRLGPVFKADLPIREAQIVQETRQRIRMRLVKAPGYTERVGQSIVQRLRDRVGNMEIVLEPVESIPRSANGKFRAVINQVESAEPPYQPVEKGTGSEPRTGNAR